MRFLAAIGALCFLALGSNAMAQIRVSAQTERSDFLLYERVDLIVTIANAGENDLELDNLDGHPWLSFLVSKHNRLPVRQERDATFKPLTLKVGETKTLRVNLTPLFSFREEGQYNAAVVIELPGAGQMVSESVPFNVVHGREVWHATRPADGTQRDYSLIRFSPTSQVTRLYLRVEDPSENVVLCNRALGDVVAYIDPDVYFDPQGNLHIMQPIAMSTYLYTRTDPAGKILHQGIFKAAPMNGAPGLVPPRLTKLDDGSVIIQGGVEQDVNSPREVLSDGQKSASTPADNKVDSPAPLDSPTSPASLPAPAPLAPVADH
jgi:hypothetical protein